MSNVACRLSEDALDLEALIADTVDPRSGALVVFGGTVRNHHEGRVVAQLNYSAYAPLGEKLIRAIEAETLARFDVHHCRVVHRTGALAIGEAAIYAIVRAAHRREAFAAAQYAVDAVKHRVPVWKEEFYADGTSAFVQGCCIAHPDVAVILSEAKDPGGKEILRRFAPQDDRGLANDGEAA